MFRYTRAGRIFPTFLAHSFGLLGKLPPVFRGCELQVIDADGGKATVGPHCQCEVAVRHWTSKREAIPEDRRAEVILRRRDRHPLALKVPLWVACSVGAPGGKMWPDTDDDVRFQTRAAVSQLPPSHSRGAFRHHLQEGVQPGQPTTSFPWWSSRCCMPRGVYTVHSAVDKATNNYSSGGSQASVPDSPIPPPPPPPHPTNSSPNSNPLATPPTQTPNPCETTVGSPQAMESVEHFLSALGEEMGVILGRVGISESMCTLLDLASVAWDWEFLVLKRPTAKHVRAFLGVNAMLKPFLKHTLWPSPHMFRNLQRNWELSDAEMSWQYMLLLSRVRAIAARATGGKPPSYARRWLEAKNYTVVGLWARGSVRWVLRHCLGGSPVLVQIGALVTDFLDGPADAAPFAVSPQGLHAAGAPRGRAKQQRFSGSVGTVAVLTSAPFAQKFVMVQAMEAQVQVDEVSASLDAEPFFVHGPGPARRGALVWHALRLHHRCRMLFPGESACERLGSQMHRFFDARQNPAPGPLMDRVYLAQDTTIQQPPPSPQPDFRPIRHPLPRPAALARRTCTLWAASETSCLSTPSPSC